MEFMKFAVVATNSMRRLTLEVAKKFKCSIKVKFALSKIVNFASLVM